MRAENHGDRTTSGPTFPKLEWKHCGDRRGGRACRVRYVLFTGCCVPGVASSSTIQRPGRRQRVSLHTPAPPLHSHKQQPTIAMGRNSCGGWRWAKRHVSFGAGCLGKSWVGRYQALAGAGRHASQPAAPPGPPEPHNHCVPRPTACSPTWSPSARHFCCTSASSPALCRSHTSDVPTTTRNQPNTRPRPWIGKGGGCTVT